MWQSAGWIQHEIKWTNMVGYARLAYIIDDIVPSFLSCPELYDIRAWKGNKNICREVEMKQNNVMAGRMSSLHFTIIISNFDNINVQIQIGWDVRGDDGMTITDRRKMYNICTFLLSNGITNCE